MKAVELEGMIDENRQLKIKGDLPIQGPLRVRVILLYADEAEDIDEGAWLYAAARNPAFAFLKDDSEDIYSLQDGRPFYDDEA
ncbi:MAG TPA: hypothetical protein ENK60_01880 [Anaerolineae bacterium]|nr:hypothetical protein [Anaerolineae bacterium]